MKKHFFFKWCLSFLLVLSLMWMGCPGTSPRREGNESILPAAVVVELSHGGYLNQLTASWSAVDGSTQYEVKYSKDNNEAEAVLWTAAPISQTSSTITDLEIDTLYYVWVRAMNEAGWGPWGVESMKTFDGNIIVAGAPTRAPSLGGWSAYEIGGTDRDSTVNMYRDSTTYSGAIGEWLTQDINGKDSNLLSGVVMAQWKAIEGATSYNVYVASATANATDDILPDTPDRPATPTANTTRLSYFVRDANPGNAYFIWVEAKNDAGVGPVSSPYGGKLRSDRKDTQTDSIWYQPDIIERAHYPKSLKATVTGNGSVYLSWDRSDRAVWYEVYYHTSDLVFAPSLIGETWWENVWDDTDVRLIPYKRIDGPEWNLQDTALPWNDKAGKPGNLYEIHKIYSCEAFITGLDPAKSYWFWVRGLNHNGERGMAKVSIIKSTVSGLAAPTGVTASPISPGGGGMLKVEWNQVTGATGYKVYYSKYDNPMLSLPNISVNEGSTTNYTLRGLDENNRYYVWVVAIDADGQSDFSKSATGVPSFKDGTEPVSVLKNSIWGDPLRNFVYVEVNNNDPRVALNWELETGEKFFDVVVLFASNIRMRDCANASPDDKATHQCTLNGPHIHHNGNVQYVLTNRAKYIKPLQDAGIKVTMGLLGDHDRFIYYQVGSWPFEEAAPWSSYTGDLKTRSLVWAGAGANDTYPMGPEFREAFLGHLADEIQKYGLDGFDFDDEWSDFSRPDYSQASYQQMSKNYAEWIYIMREKLGPDAIISLYQWNSLTDYQFGVSGSTFNKGTYVSGNSNNPLIPPAGTYGIDYGYTSTDMVDINPNVWTYATCAGYASYGGIGSPFAGIPNSQYSPFAIGFHNMVGSTNYSVYTNAEPKYGWLLFYDLGSRAAQGTAAFNLINQYAVNLFGKNIMYNGVDYPQDWVKW
jgi:hypothetical protein